MNHINENTGKTFHEDGKEAVQPSKAGEDGLNAESKSSLCGSSTDNEEELGEEEQDPVTKEIVEQRKGYVRRMCSIFNKIQQQAQENSSPLKGPMAAVGFLSKNSPNAGPSPVKQSLLQSPDPMCENDSSQHLFECVLLVGLTLSSGSDKGSIYVPYIKSKFPANVLVPPLIEHLCFPDASDWTIRRSLSPKADGSKKRDSKSDDEMKVDGCDQTYSLVITGADGSRRFGYCRRVLPEGGSMCLPLTYCLISPYRANGFYFKVLAELESRHGGPESEQNAFLQELYSCHLPGPSEVLQLPSSAEPLSPFVQPLRRPFDVRLEEKEVMELVTCLEVGVFLDVFASILLERKVLLTSKYLSKLSCCVQALQSVLYPFTWQHTFIPVLPAPMFDICGAPTPYIIGILKGSNGQIPSISLDEGIMVDLDTSNCIKKVGDEGSILPSRMKRMLQSALRIISSMKNSQQNSNKKNANSGDDIDVCNVLVSDAFMGTFLFVVGHYPNHVVKHGDGHRTFQREKFIKAMPFSGVRMFLEWFTETAMFTSFINASLEGSGDSEFERRAKQFCEETWKDSLLFLKAYKNFMKKSKSFGDRKKDWAIFT
ncbi:hypothetical protein J437_LFUL005802 [Ladona fulva]|uniref:UDENN domain-containing protein n=1 Tax=Ladona fulva TaxID=123851 RepID=A0A8K0K0N0_LADFU|nr:hypothetical protein J437_LFUL005802 [Ladona fulva]